MIIDNHEQYRHSAFFFRRLTHELVMSQIDKLDILKFDVEMLGQSVENREIRVIRFGRGNDHIFLWSQMHGNEATATQTIFDIFNFLSADDEHNAFREIINSKFTLHFIPMVNPDGAYRFQRENALNIDLNRDALRRAMPETRILMDYQDRVKPMIGFNLHDQRTHYNVSGTGKTATISFLAPAFNREKELNPHRELAMKCIVSMSQILNAYIPGYLARYDDTHGPRCVGDQFQARGTATILIESGAFKDDIERQYVRKLNFIAIINLLRSLIDGTVQSNTIDEYFRIPENDEKLFDILIRNVSIHHEFQCDIGLRFKEFTDIESRNFVTESFIEEIGDLSNSYGITEFDAKDYVMEFGKIYDKEFIENDEKNLIRNGYTALKKTESHLLRIIQYIPYEFKIDCGMDFIFKKDEDVKYAIINNQLIDLT